MGEVFRARDTRLNRDVAVQMLTAYLLQRRNMKPSDLSTL